MEFVHYYIYGREKVSSWVMANRLWKCFDSFTTVDKHNVDSKRKWFLHGHHNYHYVNGVVRMSLMGERISTAQFWTTVYLGFKDFEYFYRECGDIFLP